MKKTVHRQMTPAVWHTPFHRNAYALPAGPYFTFSTPMTVAAAVLPRISEKCRSSALAEQNCPYCFAGKICIISGIFEDSSSCDSGWWMQYSATYIPNALSAKPHAE